MSLKNETLVALTADIVSAYVENSSVGTGEIGHLIKNVYWALKRLSTPIEEVKARPRAAVSVRASVKPNQLISMIDGKPYKLLKRHLSRNGYTPESYRETFGLPDDYPMVAPTYTELRRAIAYKIGLGGKRWAATSPVEAKPEFAPKAVREPRTRKPFPTVAEARPSGR